MVHAFPHLFNFPEVPFWQVGQPESRLAYFFGSHVLRFDPLFNLPVPLEKWPIADGG